MKTVIPPPILFLSNLHGLKKPSVKNRDPKKVSSSFVSVTTRMFIYFSTVSFNCSNLFLLMELIFKLPILTLFAFPILISFILLVIIFGIVLMDFFSD